MSIDQNTIVTSDTELDLLPGTTEAGQIADLAVKASSPAIAVVDSDTVRHIFARTDDGGYRLATEIDVDGLRRDHDALPPTRLAGLVTVHTPDALVTYARRHLDPDRSTLWGDVDGARITVVLNDHERNRVPADGDQAPEPGTGEPDWADHQATLTLKPSPEWDAWTGHNEKGLSQEQLAEFLEEHLREIVDPDGSTLLEVTRTFQATTGATFRRAQSLHSGQVQLTWQEEGEATAGTSGQLEVPREFTIRIRPFLGTDPVDVRGQFRYRVTNGQLALGYRLLNLDDHRRAAVEDVLEDVADQLSLSPIEGVAPKVRR